MWKAWLASAYTVAGRYEEAGAAASHALDLAVDTRSARAWNVLQSLPRQFGASSRTSEVRKFLLALTASTENWTA